MSSNCIHGKQCLYAYADNAYCLMCDSGEYFKPMTNADCVRAMSDEELAMFLNGSVSPCPDPWYVGANCPYDNPNCDLCWLDWLHREAEGEDNG